MDSISEKQWILLSHLGTLIGFFVPFGNIIVPLVIYSMKKDYPLIRAHSRNSLNFQLSITIYVIIAGILIILLVGVALLAILAMLQLIFVIVATVKADKNELYHYPLTIEFVKE